MDQGLSIAIEDTRDELNVIAELLQLDGKDILDLGCGRAEKTRAIAEAGANRRILALEVDEAQHALNQEIDDLPSVRFEIGAAEKIPAADRSFDVVFLFKSLHHVPVESMDQALAEIARVLRPGGLAYISEPIFRGPFNEILRIFHDESRVRTEAFGALERAVRSGAFELESQTFFLSPLHFAGFSAFEEHVIGATHTEFDLTDGRYERARETFASFEGEDGAHFEQPIRVDLLRRPATLG
jgi:SAM-dependent methyltransferase